MKEKLHELSRLLMGIHKSLLLYEKDLQEKRENRSLNPHEMLHLSLHDAHFAWLRKISDLIVAIDTRVDAKEALTENDCALFSSEVAELFFSDSEKPHEFKAKLMAAVSSNSEIILQLSSIRTFLKNNPLPAH